MSTEPDTLPFGAEHRYLENLVGFKALKEALALGVIDHLVAGPSSLSCLARETGCAPKRLAALCDLLTRSGIVSDAKDIALTPEFCEVLTARRPILEAKVGFLDKAISDVSGDLNALFFDLERFQDRSETFAFFRYDLALDVRPQSLAATRPWVEYVTALSESETPWLLPHIDLSGCQRLLEIGGNTGVLSQALVEKHTGLTAAVLDLPAVCALGEERLQSTPTRSRLAFVPGDARETAWPGPVDAVLFKSVLHDWLEPDVQRFLESAANCLKPDGRIIICERVPVRQTKGPLPLWMMANLVFEPFYRDHALYEEFCTGLGMTGSAPILVDLEMPFEIRVFKRT